MKIACLTNKLLEADSSHHQQQIKSFGFRCLCWQLPVFPCKDHRNIVWLLETNEKIFAASEYGAKNRKYRYNPNSWLFVLWSSAVQSAFPNFALDADDQEVS